MVCSIGVVLAVMCIPPPPCVLRKIFETNDLGPDLVCKVLILLGHVPQNLPNAGFRCACWPVFWPARKVALWCCPQLLLYSGCQGFFGIGHSGVTTSLAN